MSILLYYLPFFFSGVAHSTCNLRRQSRFKNIPSNVTQKSFLSVINLTMCFFQFMYTT